MIKLLLPLFFSFGICLVGCDEKKSEGTDVDGTDDSDIAQEDMPEVADLADLEVDPEMPADSMEDPEGDPEADAVQDTEADADAGDIHEDEACVHETDEEFCHRLLAECGELTAADNCGSERTVSSCGECVDETFWECVYGSDTARTCEDVDECATDNGGCGDEAFWTCTNNEGAAPTCTDRCVAGHTAIALPIVIRDFSVAHPDMENGIGVDLGIVEASLGSDGKAVYANPGGTTPTTSGSANFDQWYRDVSGINIAFEQVISLLEISSTEFQYSNTSFFPIDGLGWGNEGYVHNYHFTTELRFFFRYQGDEQLFFTGDDDVWVFVNERLAIDLGGVHGAMSGSVSLDAATASALGISLGLVYEIAVFQAERHTTESNYRLTLGGFAICPSSSP